MSLKKKSKRIIIIISAIIMTGIIGYLIVNTEKEVDNTQYLPTESILKKQIKLDIETSISNALFNIMDKTDFELAVHVNLNQDEVTEESIKYEPKEISTSSLTKI